MPRLKYHEPPQQGVSDGGVRLHGDDSPRKKRKRAPEEPLGAGRASRAKAAKPAAKRAGALTDQGRAGCTPPGVQGAAAQDAARLSRAHKALQEVRRLQELPHQPGCEGAEEKLSDLFDMKQRVLAEIVKDGGGNSFKLPHRSAAEKRAR